MAYNTIKHLEADISEYKFVKYSGAVDVVVEEPSGMLVVYLIQITLSGMTKWSMSDVMSKEIASMRSRLSPRVIPIVLAILDTSWTWSARLDISSFL